MLWGGWGEERMEPARFLFFSNYCYFYRDTQREPLPRREINKETVEVGIVYMLGSLHHRQ